jgi:competence protein ComEC
MKPRPIWLSRPLFIVAILYGAGICAGVRLQLGIWISAGLALSAAFILLSFLSKKSAFLGVCALFLFTGAMMGSLSVHPRLPAEGKYQVSAVVSGDFQLLSDGRIRGTLRDVYLTDDDGTGTRLAAGYWTYTSDTKILPLDGQTARFTGTVYHPEGQVNPFGFDFRIYLLQQGITVGISGMKDLTLTPAGQTQPDSMVIRIRNAISARFSALFGDTADLPKALLIGERSEFPEDMAMAFRRAGIAHILAISGQHVVMLMGFAMLLIRPFHPSAKVIFAVVFILLLLYCVLLGFPPSVVRAALSMLVFLFARIRRRRSDTLTSLSAAFLIILAVSPLELFSVGFQLTFASVAGIIMIGDRLKRLFSPLYARAGNGIAKWALDGLSLSLSATTGVALPLLCIFYQISWVGILLSPIACLIAGLLMAGYIIVALLSAVYMPFALFLAQPVIWLGRFFLSGTAFFGKLPYAAINLPSPAPLVIAAAILCLVLFTRYSCIRTRPKLIAGCAAVIVAVSVSQALARREVKYTQLAMGNADAAVIEDGGATFVIDAGEYGGDLAGYLLGSGRVIDHLLLTHLHSDHARGLDQLLQRGVEIGEILLPEGYNRLEITEEVSLLLEHARAAGIPIRTVSAGDQLKSDRVTITVLWPESGKARRGQDVNDFSMMLLCNLDGVSLLSSGDNGIAYERYAAQPAQVLKVAHHGSRFGTGEVFLNIVSPALALVSANDDRSAAVALLEDRLQARDTALFTTYQSGAISLFVSNGRIQLQPYLH